MIDVKYSLELHDLVVIGVVVDIKPRPSASEQAAFEKLFVLVKNVFDLLLTYNIRSIRPWPLTTLIEKTFLWEKCFCEAALTYC